MRATFVRSLLLVLAVFATIFTLEFLLEWNRLGRPGPDAMSWVGVNNPKYVDLLSPMARAYNNILAMLLFTIGLAIPLTANMHTPKLIDIFLRDRINQFMLFLMALGAANVLFVAYIIGPEFVPIGAIQVAVFTVLAGWALLIPYFFYVVRFLDPSHIIVRLQDQATQEIGRVHRGGADIARSQHEVEERIDQIGTIVLKSLDRGDRGVAREGVWAFKRIIDRYGEQKASLPDEWFSVHRADFVGLSRDVLALVSDARTWLEMRALMQMELAFRHALSKASDTVSSMCDANRVIAHSAAERGDEEVLSLSIRFFNNFLRDSISTSSAHAMYHVFYHYRLLARELSDRSERLREIGRHFRYYGERALNAGLGMAGELPAFDLGFLVRRAYEAESPAAPDLLEEMLGMRHRADDRILTMVVKAKIVAGGFCVEQGLFAEAARMRENLADVPGEDLAAAVRDLLAADRVFFEVSDRMVDIEYVPPERRKPVQEFLAGM